MINAIAIDDEPPALKIIESFSASDNIINLQKTFTKPNEALRYVENFPVDLLFLDIQMPSLSGIEFYKRIKQDTMVIFTTAFSEYAVEGFNLSAIDYLLKPFTFERFTQAVNKANEFYAYQLQTEKTDQFIFIRADYSLLKINTTDIVYIEGLDDYLKIHLQNQKTIVTRMTMKSILDKLPYKEFIRIHRSFIIPLSRVQSVRNRMVMVDGNQIAIGSSYEESFYDIFKNQ